MKMRILPILFACLLSFQAHTIEFFPASGAGAAATTAPQWQEFTINYTDFTAAATSEDILLISLAADSVLHGVQIKHTAQFVGGGATFYLASVGIMGDYERFASDFDVATGVSNTNHQDTLVLDDANTGAAIPVRIRATSDVNLNTLGAGTVRVRLLVSNP